ncbi:MAG: lysophospholipid acyltransferase family protein [Myxococcota bacterium]
MKRFLSTLLLRCTGWTAEGDRPAAAKYVLIAAPHTTNWDLLFFLAIAWHLEVKVAWMGKHSLFRGPFGPIMRALGGIAVRRNRSGNRVEQMAGEFDRVDSLVLTVPPEGTRSYVAHWRSGFYHIALAARVPIVLGYLDYAQKVGGLGPEIIPTGNVREDMEQIRDFYSDVRALHPERFGEILLKEER